VFVNIFKLTKVLQFCNAILALVTRSYFTPFDRKSEDRNFLPSEKTNRQKEKRTGEYTVSLSLYLTNTDKRNSEPLKRVRAHHLGIGEKRKKKKMASQEGGSASSPSYSQTIRRVHCLSLTQQQQQRTAQEGSLSSSLSHSHTQECVHKRSLPLSHTHTHTHIRVCAT
jgi:hypothetical protein